MNIYIGVEISARELDSSLLLATVAASKGHNVIVSDLESITKGIDAGLLGKGIFHAKSLTPAEHKIARHENMIGKGFMITSLDEEGGLDIAGYEEFSKTRYSDHTISQSSAVFCWGADDEETLKKAYSKHSKKIYKTGSPRSDLWKPRFSSYWIKPREAPEKPFLLISSNMGLANTPVPFYKYFELKKKFGYYKHDPELLKKDMERVGEDFLRTFSFIEAIQLLAANNNGYDIVLRPHPTEDVDSWKIYLKDIPNVHVIRRGSISAWVNNAFAVMHSRCTTALEATISLKPVITYIPYENLKYSDAPSNKVGQIVDTPEKLLRSINKIFSDSQLDDSIIKKDFIPEIVLNKIHVDKNELSSNKIINVWESLSKDKISSPSSWTMFKWLLKFYKLRKMIGKTKRLLGAIDSKNEKFPTLKEDDIHESIRRLQTILKIDDIKFELISDRTILIKKN